MYFLDLVHLIPSWLILAKIECTVHIALPKQPINQFKPLKQSRQQALGAYCLEIYTVIRYFTLQIHPSGIEARSCNPALPAAACLFWWLRAALEISCWAIPRNIDLLWIDFMKVLMQKLFLDTTTYLLSSRKQ